MSLNVVKGAKRGKTKNFQNFLSLIVAELLNMCLKGSCFPDCWKVPSVVLVFKNVRERSTAKNYRPISLLSTKFGMLVFFTNLSLMEFQVSYLALFPLEAELFARCSLLVTFCSLLVTFCSLPVTFYSLLVTSCSLLITFCSLLVTFSSKLLRNKITVNRKKMV